MGSRMNNSRVVQSQDLWQKPPCDSNSFGLHLHELASRHPPRRQREKRPVPDEVRALAEFREGPKSGPKMLRLTAATFRRDIAAASRDTHGST